MGQMLAIAMKDIRLLLRDRMACFFTFVFPVIFGVIFGTIFSGGGSGAEKGKMRVLVVDEDRSAASAAFVTDLGKSADLALTDVATRDEAAAQVRAGGGAMGFVCVPKGFGERAEMPFGAEGATIEVATDPSRAAEAGMLRGIVLEKSYAAVFGMIADTEKMRGAVKKAQIALEADRETPLTTKLAMRTFLGTLDPMLAAIPKDDGGAEGDGSSAIAGWQPVKVVTSEVRAEKKRKGPSNAYDVTFAQAMMWGVMGCASGFAMGLGEERQRGTLLRLRVSPLSWSKLLGGKGLACFLATIGVAALVLAVGMLVFKVNIGSWALLAVALLSVAIGFVGIMMLLAVLGRASGSGQIGWAVMLVMSIFGGGMVPLFVMPGFMQRLSDFSPVKWGILAFEGAIWRGFTMEQMVMPVGILVGIGGVGFVVGAVSLRKA